MREEGWALVESGRYTEAIKKLQEEFKQDKETATATSLGLAYLLAGNPSAALTVFDGTLSDRWVSTGHYAFAGIARWLLGRKKEAATVWKKGIGCQYADAAGGMELPLLLYFAAVREPSSFALSKAKDMIRTATKHRWAKSWPGPLGGFVLGQMSEAEIRDAAVFSNEDITRCQTAQVEFYVGIKALEARDSRPFKRQMKVCVKIPNWYLENEYHLARGEVSAMQGKRGVE